MWKRRPKYTPVYKAKRDCAKFFLTVKKSKGGEISRVSVGSYKQNTMCKNYLQFEELIVAVAKKYDGKWSVPHNAVEKEQKQTINRKETKLLPVRISWVVSVVSQQNKYVFLKRIVCLSFFYLPLTLHLQFWLILLSLSRLIRKKMQNKKYEWIRRCWLTKACGYSFIKQGSREHIFIRSTILDIFQYTLLW